jgi:hypothetical protein
MNAATILQGWRFVTGLRRHLKMQPPTLDVARAELREELGRRGERFLENLDHLVWSVPASPYLPLLAHAGFDADAVGRMVRREGLDGALATLRDAGVYVSYAEWSGKVPIRRGGLELAVAPQDFFNPRVKADYVGSTGASRSGGTPVASSFSHQEAGAGRTVLRWEAWGVTDAPMAIWFPVLPSSAGLNSVIRGAAYGQPVERWFSQVSPSLRGIPLEKRLTNQLLPVAGRLAGVRLARPELATPSDASPVLDWCLDALDRSGVALLRGYASSIVQLGQLAARRGVRLDGLVVTLAGEPVTEAKTSALESVGVTVINTYAFMQKGGVATSCTHRGTSLLHVWDNEVALLTRPVARPDGVIVDAFLWTTLSPTARSVFLNVENDDYGVVAHDAEPCPCALGQLGLRTTVSEIRGISKVVAGGVTVPADVLVELAEQVLPSAFGGGPVDYQFLEEERGGRSSLVLRVDPRVGHVDDAAMVAAVRRRLRSSEVGLLADEVWAGEGSLRLERVSPRPTRSGKVLAFEGLAPGAR